MSYQTVNYEKKEHVATLSLLGFTNKKESVARLSNELSELCSEMGWDEGIRVILLVVDEEALSTQSFLEECVSRVDEIGQEINSFLIAEPIAKLDKPVIAAIKGKAIGQGLELALACDVRIASETSRFGLPQIKSGLIPWDGGTQRLSRLVGKGKALEMMLMGEAIEAQEALRIGLVNRVFPPDKLMIAAAEMAKEMASKGPISLRYIKEATYKGMDMTLEQGLRLEADLYLLIHTTKDRTEGIRAFQQKRIPRFEGK